MNNPRSSFAFLAALAVFLGLMICFPARSRAEDWNVTAIDQLLDGVAPDQQYVQIGDQQISVAYLESWRDKLAGGIQVQPAVAASGSFTPWTGGNVYYTFDASVSAANQKVLLDCAAEWATFANLHFIARTAQANYIVVSNDVSLSGGLSYVGMIGGPQLLRIGPSAWNHGTVCHELGHALGLVHEHQRSDRDSYVTILTNNIQAGHLADFVILTDSQNLTSYDFLSVMHYRRTAFSVDSVSDTIETLPAYNQYLDIMGNRFDPGLSASDRAGIAMIYGAGPGATNIVTNTQDSGPGSLRAALYYAYDHPGTTISFNIPTSDPGFSNDVFNILPTDALPSLWNVTTLDGGTEPTNSNPFGPEILINGALCRTESVYPSGVQIKGAGNTIRGLVVNNFTVFGALIAGSNAVGNRIEGCYLGVDPTGVSAVTNGICPVEIDDGAVSNTIGGATVAARNIIGGSAYQGLVIRDAGTRFNTVEGNYIGLNSAGSAALANAWSGVAIYGGAQSNLVGGYTSGARNVISGNELQGVTISDPTTGGNIVAGNYIGLDPSGTVSLPNGWAGVDIFDGAYGNLIGGTAVGAGNVISGNTEYGVAISSTNTPGTTIQGNLIGLNATGTVAVPNGEAGVGVFGGSASNVVGGFSAAARNVISGNTKQGVLISDIHSSGNLVAGNDIGVNPAGTAAIGNGWSGVELYYGPDSNIIASNLISGNLNHGVIINGAGSANNSIWGNYIGVNVTGTSAISNAWAGVCLYAGAQSNLVGGATASARNLISGNGNQGVALLFAGVNGNRIQGNFIGLNAAGTAAVPNVWSGVEIYSGPSGNVVGGAGGARNFISGNGNYGVRIDYGSSRNQVLGNTIGLNAANNTALPNAFAGMQLFAGAVSNQVGGTSFGDANLISGNASDGVQVSDLATSNNTVRGNSIVGNGGVGIGLYGGANLSAPAPVLSSAVLGTNTIVRGSLTGSGGTTYQTDYYANPVTPDASEGMTYLGSRSVTTSAGGTVTFTNGLGALIPAGRIITATSTDPAGNTSAFSGGVPVTTISTVNDGVPDAWRAAYFGGTGMTTNSSSCATCDADGDGMNNQSEFYAGTNPTNAASVFKLTALNPAGSGNVASLSSVSGISYRVESRDDLATASWSLFANQLIGIGGPMTISDTNAIVLTKRFYRASVQW